MLEIQFQHTFSAFIIRCAVIYESHIIFCNPSVGTCLTVCIRQIDFQPYTLGHGIRCSVIVAQSGDTSAADAYLRSMIDVEHMTVFVILVERMVGRCAAFGAYHQLLWRTLGHHCYFGRRGCVIVGYLVSLHSHVAAQRRDSFSGGPLKLHHGLAPCRYAFRPSGRRERLPVLVEQTHRISRHICRSLVHYFHTVRICVARYRLHLSRNSQCGKISFREFLDVELVNEQIAAARLRHVAYGDIVISAVFHRERQLFFCDLPTS